MSFLNALIRVPLELYVSLFGTAHPLWSLVPLSIVVGVAMLWVFKVTSNQKAIERAKKKMQAYLLELRLYGDDPALLFSAQKNLIVSNLRYLGLMFKPAIYLTIPMIFLLFHLDAVYGVRPLQPGEEVPLTIKATARLSPTAPVPEMTLPDGFEAATPAVRALEPGEYSWRIKALDSKDGAAKFRWMGQEFEKSLESGPGLRYVSHTRASSFLDQIAAPGEGGLDVENLDWIEVRYAPNEIDAFGFQLHWLVWFLILSVVAAYALKGVFGVAL